MNKITVTITLADQTIVAQQDMDLDEWAEYIMVIDPGNPMSGRVTVKRIQGPA